MSSFKLCFSRYNGYNPLYTSNTSSTRYNSYRILVPLALVAASIILNIVFVARKIFSHSPINPLDDYQGLNPSPPWEGFRPGSNQTTAVVTTLYSDAYAPAVATLGHSLQKANTTARMVVLYFPEKIHPDALCLATSSGFIPHAIDRIAPPHEGAGINPHFIDQYSKLSLWKMDSIGIDSIVYLDADTLVVRNFDEIFELPYTFGAVPDVFGDRGFILEFNAGVLFVRPDSRVFQAMLEALPKARYPPEFAEQAFLNQFFSSTAVRLPYIYNGNLAYKSRSPKMWEGIRDHLRVIHYTVAKPFLGKSWGKPLPWDGLDARVTEVAAAKRGFFHDEVMLWGQYWDETRQAYELVRDECWTRTRTRTRTTQ